MNNKLLSAKLLSSIGITSRDKKVEEITDKETREHDNLTKLKRVDLLELLVAQRKEIDQLRKELKETKEELSKRRFVFENAGSIAEASLQISEVFRAAQEAADLYLENIRAMEQEAAKQHYNI